jgi:hypothetical protein
MDSLEDILRQRDFDEPSEVTSLKRYINETFASAATVQVREKNLIVTVPNAALATTLRLRAPEIKRRCQISDKRLIFRIG